MFGRAVRRACVSVLALTLLAASGCSLLPGGGADALEAAEAAQVALWHNDRGAFEDLLVPEIAAEMTAEDYDRLWQVFSMEWQTVQTTPGDGRLTVRYELDDLAGSGPATLEMRYALDTLSRDKATVTATSSMRSEAAEEPTEQDMVYELVRADGAWRLASFQDITFGMAFVFFSEGSAPEDTLMAFRDSLMTWIPGGEADSPTLPPGVDGSATMALQQVSEHYAAIIEGDWERAYETLPASTQAQYSADSFREQVSGYEIVGAEIAESTFDTATGEFVVLALVRTGSFGDFTYEWRFKQVGPEWVAVSRAVAGMSDDAGEAPQLTPDELEEGGLPPGHPDLGTASD